MRSSVTSARGTSRRRGMLLLRGGTVGGRLRLVGDVRVAEGPRPAGELQEDPVRVLEVERPDEHAVVHLAGHTRRAVVVVEDRAHLDALLPEPAPVVIESGRRDMEGHMVHRADRAEQLALLGPGLRRGDAGDAGRRVREPEERQAVAAAAVEEEVLPHAVGQLDRFDQRHAQDAGVEVDRLLHVGRDQREMVDPAELELGIGHGTSLAGTRESGNAAVSLFYTYFPAPSASWTPRLPSDGFLLAARLPCRTRITRSGRSRVCGRSLSPMTLTSAAASVSSRVAAVCSRGR